MSTIGSAFPALYSGTGHSFQRDGVAHHQFEYDSYPQPGVAQMPATNLNKGLMSVAGPPNVTANPRDALYQGAAATHHELFDREPEILFTEVIHSTMDDSRVPHFRIMPPRLASEKEMKGIAIGVLKFGDQMMSEVPENTAVRTLVHQEYSSYGMQRRFGLGFRVSHDAVGTEPGQHIIREYMKCLSNNTRILAVSLISAALVKAKDVYRAHRTQFMEQGILANDPNGHKILRPICPLHRGDRDIYRIINDIKDAGKSNNSSGFDCLLVSPTAKNVITYGPEENREYYRIGPESVDIRHNGTDHFMRNPINGLAVYEEPRRVYMRQGVEGATPSSCFERIVEVGRHYVRTFENMISKHKDVNFKQSSALAFMNIEKGYGAVDVQTYDEILDAMACFDPKTGELSPIYKRLVQDNGALLMETAKTLHIRSSPGQGFRADPFLNWLPGDSKPRVVHFWGEQDPYYTSLEDQQLICEAVVQRIFQRIPQEHIANMQQIIRFLERNYESNVHEKYLVAWHFSDMVHLNSPNPTTRLPYAVKIDSLRNSPLSFLGVDNETIFVGTRTDSANFQHADSILTSEGLDELLTAHNEAENSGKNFSFFLAKKDTIKPTHFPLLVPAQQIWPGVSTIFNLAEVITNNAESLVTWDTNFTAWNIARNCQNALDTMKILANDLKSIFDSHLPEGKNFFCSIADKIRANSGAIKRSAHGDHELFLLQVLFQGFRANTMYNIQGSHKKGSLHFSKSVFENGDTRWFQQESPDDIHNWFLVFEREKEMGDSRFTSYPRRNVNSKTRKDSSAFGMYFPDPYTADFDFVTKKTDKRKWGEDNSADPEYLGRRMLEDDNIDLAGVFAGIKVPRNTIFWAQRLVPNSSFVVTSGTPHAAVLYAVNAMYCGARVHRDICKQMYNNNIPVPIGYIAFDPWVQMKTSCAIACNTRGTVGFLSHFLPDITHAYDGTHKMDEWSLTVHMGTIVTRPWEMCIIPNFNYERYISGGNGKLIYTGLGDKDTSSAFTHDTLSALERGVGYNPSIMERAGNRIIMHIGCSRKRGDFPSYIPLAGPVTNPAIGLLDWVPRSIANGKSIYDRHPMAYDSGIFGVVKFHFNLAVPASVSFEEDASYTEECLLNNSSTMITCQGCRWDYNPSTGLYDLHVETGEGPLGPTPVGCRKVFDGEAVTMERLIASGKGLVTAAY